MSDGPVVVVGAGPGIGLATARRFSREGRDVVLVARDRDRLVEMSLRDFPAAPSGHRPAAAPGSPPAYLPVDVVAADAADEASLRAAFATVREHHGDPAVVVYNPSVHVEAALADVDLEDFRAALEVGAVGFVVALQEAVPGMRRAGSGTVLATGGGLALSPAAGWGTLSAEKAALRALVVAAHRELARGGVHVAMVTVAGTVGAPGLEPEQVADAFWDLHAQPRDAWERERVLRAE